jgi:nucleoside-triphosphatase
MEPGRLQRLEPDQDEGLFWVQNSGKNILFTGLPGCGKSTIIEKIVRRLKQPCTGFFTKEIRDRRRRVGFSISTLDGKHGILAHVDLRTDIRLGRYGVNLRDIEKIAVPAMAPENDKVVVVIDEIGKMECFSARFKQALMAALDSPNALVGSISLKGDAFIDAVKKRPDTLLVPVSRENRDYLVEDYFAQKIHS